jgi:hypothetical protein
LHPVVVYREIALDLTEPACPAVDVLFDELAKACLTRIDEPSPRSTRGSNEQNGMNRSYPSAMSRIDRVVL